MSEPDLAAKPAPARDAAALRVPSGVGVPVGGPIAANVNRRASDDEFAVDAREVTRRPSPTSGPTNGVTSSAPNGARPAAQSATLRQPALPRAGSSAANPPKLNVLYVANGRIRAYGPQIWIRGTVEDDTEGTEVTVNGQKAQVKDKSFQRRVTVPPGETEMTVRAEDIDGNVTTSRFVLVRSGASQSLPAARPPADIASPDYRLIEQPGLDRVPRIEDVQDAGVYMVLMAGTPSAHFIKMPNLAQCREAVEYTENAACTFHRGRD
jgi:hypothetical protein